MAVCNQGYAGGITLGSTPEPKWALGVSMQTSFYYNFLVLLNHYFSENDPVGLEVSMFSPRLGAAFSSRALSFLFAVGNQTHPAAHRHGMWLRR